MNTHPINHKKVLTKDQVIEMVENSGKDGEDVFEYLNGLELRINNDKYYRTEDVIRYINR